MSKYRELVIAVLSEAAKSVHPMAVHAYPSGKNQFTVHAVGSKVEHVKPGDKVSSSDLDDLTDAGHKVKEVKKPMNEEVEQIDEASTPEIKPTDFHAWRQGKMSVDDVAKKYDTDPSRAHSELKLHKDHWDQGEAHYNKIFKP